MRITVGVVIQLLAAGESETTILENYPDLEPADIYAALAYAAWRTREAELPLTG